MEFESVDDILEYYKNENKDKNNKVKEKGGDQSGETS